MVQYGPFVMNSEEEIRQTFEDFRMAKNGFENARSWVSEIGQRRWFVLLGGTTQLA